MKNKINITFISLFIIVFSCINALATSYEEIKTPSGSVSSGGGGGGGGLLSDIKTYTYSTDGTPLTSEPIDGTEVDLTIQIIFKKEFCSYAVAVYDNDMRLVSTKLHTPDNTNRLESEFITLRTKYYRDGDICVYKLEDLNNFKAVENKTLKHFNLSGEKIPKMVYFRDVDIAAYDESSITVSDDTEDKTYNLTNDTYYIENYRLVNKFNPYGGYYSAEVIDGNITYLYCADTSIGKVIAVNDSYIVDDNGESYEISDIIAYSDIEKGDIVVIDKYKTKYRITKAEAISGVITETEDYYKFVTDNASYDFECHIDYNFFEGETCFGYNNYYDNQIRMLEKDYSKKAPVPFTEYKDNCLYTYGGNFSTDDLIKVQGTTFESFSLYFLTDVDGNTYIESMPEVYRGTATYNAVTNSINGYILDENTKVFGFGSTLNIAMPKTTFQYNMKLYSSNGIHIDYVIYEDPTDSAICEDVYMLVDEFKYNAFYGYVDGNYEKIKTDIKAFDHKCAYVKLAVNKKTDKAVRCSVIFANDSFGQDKVSTNTSGIIQLPVYGVSGDVITLTDETRPYSIKVSENTEIFEYYTDDDFLDTAELKDIFYNPVYPSSSDRVLINYSNSIADTIIIIR